MIVNNAEEALKIYKSGVTNIIISDCKDIWYRDLFLSITLGELQKNKLDLFNQVLYYDDWQHGVQIVVPNSVKDKPEQKVILSKLNPKGRTEIKTETARSVPQFFQVLAKQIESTYTYVQLDLFKNTLFKVPPDSLIDLTAFLKHVYTPLSPEEEVITTTTGSKASKNYKKASLVVLFVDDLSYYKHLEEVTIFLTNVTLDTQSIDKFMKYTQPFRGNMTVMEEASLRSDLSVLSPTNYWSINRELREIKSPTKTDLLSIVERYTREHYFSGLLDRISSDLTFDKVSGMEFIKEYIVDNIAGIWKDQELATKYGISIEKGILLYGLPGTGKTFITQALGNELNLPVYSFDFAKIASKWVGETENKLRQLLNFIDKVSPCVLFIDELESTTFDRGSTHTNTSYMNVVNMLLQYIGSPTRNNIIVGATNLIENIDPAMLRKGRLSSILYVELPELKEREITLRNLTEKNGIKTDINYPELALATKNFSRAELADLVVVTKRRVLLKQKATKLVTKDFIHTLESSKLPDNRNDMIKQYNSLAHFYGAVMEPKDTRELATKPVGTELKVSKPSIRIVPGDPSNN